MILVTGATGLVGSHLLCYLTLKNNKVRAIYRTEKKREYVKTIFSYYTSDVQKQYAKIEWVKADITDISSLYPVFKDVCEVYHCAALISFSSSNYEKMRLINIEGTANIVNFSIDAKVKKLCFVSSIATLGDNVKKEPITEENEWNEENNDYAITKYGAEMEVWRASQEGVDVVVVNPGVILGGGFWNTGSGQIFTQIYNGFNFYTKGVTGFVGVYDVVKAMVLLMESSVKNERFILVSENKSFKEVMFAIADGLDKKRPHIKIGKIVTALFWRLSWVISKVTGKEPLLTKNSSESSHSKSYYSSEKIKKEASFTFESIKDVIAKTCAQFLLDK
ncbi:NAD-dependent epimerase/dehydratase family protein [Tenacibaculum sp. UWU-22]|uniref:NAD-dependent epimerase/dehydratase family protein n=1 Tax=Tenacibaculum sp. UWU-22 TaxID=3234187 RepID=UPI0034DAC403